MSDKYFICDHVREDCAGCAHSETHEPIMQMGIDSHCTDTEECVFHEVEVKCVPHIKEADHER